MPWVAPVIGAVGSIAGGLMSGGGSASAGLSPFKVDTALGSAKVNKRGVTSSAGMGSEYGAAFNETTGGLLDLFNGAPTGQFNFDPNSLITAAGDTSTGDPFRQAGLDAIGAGSDVLSAFKSFDPNAFAAEQFDRLNSLASRGEASAARSTANQVFAKGRLGVNDTAAGNAFYDLNKAQEDARTQRALTALQFAGQEQSRLSDTGTKLLNSGTNAGVSAEQMNSSDFARILAGATGGAQIAGAQQDFRSNTLNQAITSQAGVTNAFAGETNAINQAMAGAAGTTSASTQAQAVGATIGGNRADMLGNITGSLISGLFQPKTTTGTQTT